MDARQQLLNRVEEFITVRKMAATTFGVLAVNDGKFVRRLRDGSNMTLATLEKAENYLVQAEASEPQEAV